MCDEDDAITATGGICRPVRDSLPTFTAERGGITFAPASGAWGDWKPTPLSRRRRVALAFIHGREAIGRRLVTLGHRMAGYPCGEDQDDWT